MSHYSLLASCTWVKQLHSMNKVPKFCFSSLLSMTSSSHEIFRMTVLHFSTDTCNDFLVIFMFLYMISAKPDLADTYTEPFVWYNMGKYR